MSGAAFSADAEGIALQGRALRAEESLFDTICLLDWGEGHGGTLQDAHRGIHLEGETEPHQACRCSKQDHECTHLSLHSQRPMPPDRLRDDPTPEVPRLAWDIASRKAGSKPLLTSLIFLGNQVFRHVASDPQIIDRFQHFSHTHGGYWRHGGDMIIVKLSGGVFAPVYNLDLALPFPP